MSVRRALGISGSAQLVTFLLNFGSVIVVSRVLAPSEIGVFSVSVSLLAFAHILRDFGVAQYLVHVPKLDDTKIRAAFTVTLLSAWVLAAVVFLTRDLAAAFYDEPGIAQVLMWISFNFLIVPFGSPAFALLRRDMQFGKIALVSISNTAVQVGVTVTAALLGHSYMSMVYGSIASMLTNVLLLTLLRPRGVLLWPTRQGLRDVLHFGSRVWASTTLVELGASAPDVIFGRTLGFAEAAFFSRAIGLIQQPIGQVVSLVQGVFFPSFARDVRDGDAPARLYLQAIGHLSAVTAPLLAWLTVVADLLIAFLFGPQWERAGPIGALLAAYALLFVPFALTHAALIATGHAGTTVRIQLATQGARLAVLLCSIWLPLESVVVMLGAASIASAVMNGRALRQCFAVSFGALWQTVVRSYMLAVAACAPALLLRGASSLLDLSVPGGAVLLLSAVLGIGCWWLALTLAGHPIKVEVDRLFDKLAAALARR